MNKQDKHKLEMIVRQTLNRKYLQLIKAEANIKGKSQADTLIEILEIEGSYKDLKHLTIEQDVSIKEYLANKLINYFGRIQ